MSDRPTLVTDQHFEYVAAHTRGDDAFLDRLKTAARDAGIPPIWVSGEQASLMQILVKLVHARTVVELGTLAGYSAIVMARALPADGHLHTIELDPERASFAERWAARSDVAGRITVHRGAGMEVLPRFGDGTADVCFLDADKANYPRYLAECMRIVRRGGLIMADNAFAFGELFDDVTRDRETPAIRAFNEHVPTVNGLHAVIVPVGDGLWVGVKE